MNFDLQQAFDIAITLVGMLSGWVMSNINSQLKDARIETSKLHEKIQNMEVLVAGDYVRKQDLRKDIDSIFDLLRRIEQKLDMKVDK